MTPPHELPAEGLTTGRLRELAKAIAEQLMPTTMAERHAEARAERHVRIRELAADRASEIPHDRAVAGSRGERRALSRAGMSDARVTLRHRSDYAKGGQTCRCNLAHLRRRHHMLKHHTAWTVEQDEHGVLIWTSPTGRVHTDRPPPTLRFIPDKVLERQQN
ncbi:MAG: hypothetical protein QM611_09495 [Microbacterium sp.]|uniref:hypothetical protein n=1 Tax=Microbacterium sp. TaxID=51671 RepID=UPI0039E52066